MEGEGALISPGFKKSCFAEALLPVPLHLSEASLAFGAELPSVKGIGVSGSSTGDTRSNSTHTPMYSYRTHPHSAHCPGKHPIMCPWPFLFQPPCRRAVGSSEPIPKVTLAQSPLINIPPLGIDSGNG